MVNLPMIDTVVSGSISARITRFCPSKAAQVDARLQQASEYLLRRFDSRARGAFSGFNSHDSIGFGESISKTTNFASICLKWGVRMFSSEVISRSGARESLQWLEEAQPKT
jgi:hypothetical protein